MTPIRSAPRAAPAALPRHAERAHARAATAAADSFERRSTTAQVLQRGMTGAHVRALQQKLVQAGFLSLADFRSGPGVSGPWTEAAVRRLQASVGLPQTGVAAPSTLAALNSGARPERPRVVSVEPRPPAPRAEVLRSLQETFTDEVTQPIGQPV
jgi:peptidoglycan hydrolase-like protein with peptidoglycan-binding domain